MHNETLEAWCGRPAHNAVVLYIVYIILPFNIILTTKPSCLSPCVRFWSSEYPSFIKQQCLHYYYTNSMCRVCTQVEEYIMMDAVWNHTTKEKSNLAYNLDIRICCFLYKSDTYFSVFFWLFKCPEDQRSFGAIEKNK